MNFRVGQKVVCVQAPKHSYYLHCCPNRPVKRGIYTIRGIGDVRGRTGVLLEEVVNPKIYFLDYGIREPLFHHGFFRPLVEPKTDISIFTRMLTPNTREIENV